MELVMLTFFPLSGQGPLGRTLMKMIPQHFTTSLWETGKLSQPWTSGAQISLQRVAIVPHKKFMVFIDDETLDPKCYWHGTVEELRQESREEKVDCISSTLCFLCLTYVFLVGLGQNQVVLENE
jgi:hypothetical protein